MPIMTMLEMQRSPSVGRPRALGALTADEVAEPVARHHHLADDFLRRQVADQALRAGVANEQVRVQPTWLETHNVPRSDSRNVDALDLVRPLALNLHRQAKQPLARAVDPNLLGHHLGRASV